LKAQANLVGTGWLVAMSVHYFGTFELDEDARRLSRLGKPVPLTAKVFDTLSVFVRNHGRVLDKEERSPTTGKSWYGWALPARGLSRYIHTALTLQHGAPLSARLSWLARRPCWWRCSRFARSRKPPKQFPMPGTSTVTWVTDDWICTMQCRRGTRRRDFSELSNDIREYGDVFRWNPLCVARIWCAVLATLYNVNRMVGGGREVKLSTYCRRSTPDGSPAVQIDKFLYRQ